MARWSDTLNYGCDFKLCIQLAGANRSNLRSLVLTTSRSSLPAIFGDWAIYPYIRWSRTRWQRPVFTKQYPIWLFVYLKQIRAASKRTRKQRKLRIQPRNGRVLGSGWVLYFQDCYSLVTVPVTSGSSKFVWYFLVFLKKSLSCDLKVSNYLFCCKYYDSTFLLILYPFVLYCHSIWQENILFKEKFAVVKKFNLSFIRLVRLKTLMLLPFLPQK